MTNKTPTSAKRIIAIASGKGGVGKTTVSVNLALALAQNKGRVGLLDADIYGPNVPLMLGLSHTLARVKDGKLLPVEKFNIKLMSVGFISPAEKALVWRGPLANRLVEQFLKDVDWGQLDTLVIDLPPGTGDVPLSIIQKAQLSGGVIVTTPQEAAIADVKKMIDMYQITNTRILGIIENMKYLICPDSGVKVELFPQSDSRSIKEILGQPLLTEMPFEPQIGVKNEQSEPFFINNPHHPLVKQFIQLAKKIESMIK